MISLKVKIYTQIFWVDFDHIFAFSQAKILPNSTLKLLIFVERYNYKINKICDMKMQQMKLSLTV